MAVTTLRALSLANVPPNAAFGALAAAPAQRWPVRQPGDLLDYALDVSFALFDVADDLAAVAWSASPSGPGELTAVSVGVEGGVITGWMSGGMPGRVYVVRIEATTIAGRKFEWLAGIQVSAILGPIPLPAPASPGFGPPATWAYGPGFDFSFPGNSWLLPLV